MYEANISTMVTFHSFQKPIENTNLLVHQGLSSNKNIDKNIDNFVGASSLETKILHGSYVETSI